MLNTIGKSIVVLAATMLLLGGAANAATRTVTGRVTAYSRTSISVLDHEVITLTLDSRTAFTKWVTQKPWEQDARLTANALRIGQYVAIHRRGGETGVASWVQIATDMPLMAGSTEPLTAPASVGEVGQSEGSAGDVLSPAEVLALVANAKTRADHTKLAKHFAALAARYDAEAAEHAAEAKAYRARGNPSETKRPGSPGTAAHCQRLSDLAKDSAATAREMSREHQDMAANVK